MNDTKNTSPNMWSFIRRGLAGRCPKCGVGHLFPRYLKQVEYCKACLEHLGHIRADDGPAWLTILVVGHILAPLMLILIPGNTWPDWLLMAVWLSAALILVLALLPRAKGLFIAVIWRTNCLGVK
jgi:uncharacterized protein (DUF983 family)